MKLTKHQYLRENVKGVKGKLSFSVKIEQRGFVFIKKRGLKRREKNGGGRARAGARELKIWAHPSHPSRNL